MKTPASRRLLPRVSLVAALICAAGPLGAALVSLDLSQMTARSQYIVRGEVIEMKSYWGPFLGIGEVMLTDVRIRVEEAWKGAPAGGEITLHYLGGRIGERWQHCPESPRYRTGEKVLVFVRKYNGKLWTTGWLQGKFRILESDDGVVVEGKEELPIRVSEPLASVRTRVEQLVRAQASRQKTAPADLDPDGSAGGDGRPPRETEEVKR